MRFRALRADEIDVRIGTVGAKGVSLLLYKDARVDMQILDETVGAERWQRKHDLINGNLFCSVGIYVAPEDAPAYGQWIWKQDVGTESNTEAVKGEASDSFKRACTNWGIGRELYTAPFIFLRVATEPNGNGRGYKMKNPSELYGVYVSRIEYDESDGVRKIAELELSQQGHVIYAWKGDKE